MNNHTICFYGEIRKNDLSGYPSYLEILMVRTMHKTKNVINLVLMIFVTPQ